VTSRYRCTCGLIDVHAHCLPPAYRQALSDAGFRLIHGGEVSPGITAVRCPGHTPGTHRIPDFIGIRSTADMGRYGARSGSSDGLSDGGHGI
jgi:hypothetical protein